jgi:cbb3-type cytochrome oxidase cytochrome c subunit
MIGLVAWVGFKSTWNNQNADTHDFNYWQDQYKTIAYQLSTDEATKEAIQATQDEVKQATVMQFPLLESNGSTQLRVDRCTSCHVGLLDPNMTAENIIKIHDGNHIETSGVADYLAKHPETRELVETLGAHPGLDIESGGKSTDLGVVHSPLLQYGVTTAASLTDADRADYAAQKSSMSRHPFPVFGCTTCHYGSGRELIEVKAHGDPEHWMQPILPHKYMEVACAQCHTTYNTTTNTMTYLPEMTTIARGEQLFKDKACYGCHKIEGFSKGNVGPELTNEGRTTWITSVQHQIWDPKYKVPTCVMPYFFSVQNAQAAPDGTKALVDPRWKSVEAADIDVPETESTEDIKNTLSIHGYTPNKSEQDDVDALVTFVYAQTGQNYSAGNAVRFSLVSDYNANKPPDVPVTVAEGKLLFESSGCYACHYVGDPKDHSKGKGGVAGPDLSWEGTRHSQQWLVAHYQNPQAFVPGSIMPVFPFSDTERAALALYDQTFIPAGRPATLVSPDLDMPTKQQSAYGAENRDLRYMTR